MQDSPGWRWPAFGEQGTGTGARGWTWTARRWMVVVFAVGLLHAAAYALLVPPWQSPDEPGHMEYACLMGSLGRVPQLADRSAGLQAEIIASLDRNGFWPRVRQVDPDPLPASFAMDPFLLRSGNQVGDEPPMFYLVPGLICQLGLPIEARLRLVRLFGAFLFGLTGAVAAWGAGWPRGGERGAGTAGPGLLQMVPLVLVLLPMPAFIAGSANNDSLAMLAATAVFAAVMRLQRQGWSWLGTVGLVGLLALALASKKTNGFLLAWGLLLAALSLWRGYRASRTRPRVRPYQLGLAALAMMAVPCLVWFMPTSAPSAWRSRNLAPGPPEVDAHETGNNRIAQVIPRAGQAEGRLFQTIPQDRMEALPGRTVSASVLVRSTSADAEHGRLTVRDGDGYSEVEFVAGPQWQEVSLGHVVQPSATYVKFAVTATGATAAGAGLLVDDAYLGWQPGENLLVNPGFEKEARWAEVVLLPALERWTGFLPGLQPSTALSPDALGHYALYVPLTFAGFWANFGWLQRPLPVWAYGLLAVVCLVAAVGLVRRLRSQGADGQINAAVGPWLLALALILIQTFAPMFGRAWQPQGRYLFPALLPIVGLGLLGLGHWTVLQKRPELGRRAMALLVGFAAICLIWARYGG